VKAVSKRIYREGTREYGAKSEEATEMRTQQECILSGGVYLRHRLEKLVFEKYICSAILQRYYTPSIASVQPAAFRRSGVQETVPLSD